MGIQRLKYIWVGWAPVEALKPSLSRGHLKKVTGQPEIMLHTEWKLGSVANLVSHTLFRQLGRSFSFSAQSKNRSQENITGPEPEDPVPILGKVPTLPLGNLGKPFPTLILGMVSSSQTSEKTIPDQWFSKRSPSPAASNQRTCQKLTFFKSHPSPTESEALELSPANFFFFFNIYYFLFIWLHQ